MGFQSTLKQALCLTLFTSLAYTLPQAESVTHGEAVFQPTDQTLQIATSDKAVIQWSSFSIDSQEVARFVQPSSSSVVLNQVTGSLRSEILGQLQANGVVYLVNPHGIIIGKDAIIQTAAFLASTLPVNPDDVLAGNNLHFQGDSEAAIIHLGTIQTTGGPITLLAHRIENAGKIQASSSTLITGHDILLSPTADTLLYIRPDLKGGTIESSGLITTVQQDLYGLAIQKSSDLSIVHRDGKVYLHSTGQIDISGQVESSVITATAQDRVMINASGQLKASEGRITLSMTNTDQPFYQLGIIDTSGREGGAIDIQVPKYLQHGLLLAEGHQGKGGSISIQTIQNQIEDASSRISVSGQTEGGTIQVHTGHLFSSGSYEAIGGVKGGMIQLTGPEIKLAAATLRADGISQGGTLLIGGDVHGENHLIPNANITFANSSTHLSANASQGSGGKIVIWSNEKTDFYGSAQASGGYEGHGGFIEISSGKELHANGQAVASALSGLGGEVLYDPQNIVINATTGIYPQYQFIDPTAGVGSGFGDSVAALSTGNVVITKPGDNLGAVGAGAVYVYNGITGALISTMTGSQANDAVGSGGIATLTGNGNFVITSTNWNAPGPVANVGAVTWGSGTTGIAGVVSASNSFIGTMPNDQVGSVSATVLTNGNYVICSPNWDNGGTADAGAVTWGNGTNGQLGPGGYGAVSSSNSFVGITLNDGVGSGGATGLNNGNYVVLSPNWNNGVIANAGAATWGNGTNGHLGTGIYGAVSSSNSFVGAVASDNVGSGGVFPLTNGNYVVASPFWDLGLITSNVGAVTWGNGTNGRLGTGVYGAVSSSNSIIGDVTSDNVGSGGVFPLTNGNYVVISSNFDDGAAGNAGAATWGNGTNGKLGPSPDTYGTVASSNSYVGPITNSFVGSGGVIALKNGNYVVLSPLFSLTIVGQQYGAASWGNGLTGQNGGLGYSINPGTSLVGSVNGDQVGSGGGVALTNGNYVIASPLRTIGALNNGAVTWGDGATGTTGNPVGANSLIGMSDGDQVGSDGVVALINGNYVVKSPLWDIPLGGAVDVGAVTWGNGTTGTTGNVSSANSFIGSTANDQVGSSGVVALTNGNYVVTSPNWDIPLGGAADVGAATWGNGTNGEFGPGGYGDVTASNSFVGSTALDRIGFNGAQALLTNSNYVVISSFWNNGGSTLAGAVTWGNGANGKLGTGVYGDVTASNSFVGSTTNDLVGNGGIFTLANGNYVVISTNWDIPLGGAANAGAATWGNGTDGTNIEGQYGALSIQNSVTGQLASSGLSTTIIDDTVSGTFLSKFTTEGSGVVRAGLDNPNQITFDRAEAQTMTITPAFLANTLNAGTAVTLQANNDITLSSPLTVSNSGAGGDLTLAAGRSLLIQANITTDNGNLTLIANDLLSSGVVDAYRNAGAANLTIGTGVTIDVGQGVLTLDLLNGAGKTNTTSGDIILSDNVSLLASGAGSITAQAAVNNIQLGSNVLIQAQTGDVLLKAGTDITASGAATIQTTIGSLTLVVDDLFPISPLVGSGKFNISGVTLQTGGGNLRLYAGAYGIGFFPATINGVAYIVGGSPYETVTTYYPDGSGGVPFEVFYKTDLIPPPPPPTPVSPVSPLSPSVIAHGFQRLYSTVSNIFGIWQNPFFGPGLSVDHYPPAETFKGLQMVLPSLIESEDTSQKSVTKSPSLIETKDISQEPVNISPTLSESKDMSQELLNAPPTLSELKDTSQESVNISPTLSESKDMSQEPVNQQ